MAKILKGKDAADKITAQLKEQVEKLKVDGINPCLGIIRLGENPSDLAYERGAVSRSQKVGASVKKFTYSETITQDELTEEIVRINKDKDIHGVLIFRPLPKHIDEEKIGSALAPSKDMDGITKGSLAGIFAGTQEGFPPCTAEAVMEILKFYGVSLEGKNVVVLGRSLVIGKPVAMMAISQNATVTICHSKTRNLEEICKGADIIISAIGKANFLGKNHISLEKEQTQILIDVGINFDKNGTLCGDIDFEEVEEAVGGITPVPGGVGSVTSTILFKHLIEGITKGAANGEK